MRRLLFLIFLVQACYSVGVEWLGSPTKSSNSSYLSLLVNEVKEAFDDFKRFYQRDYLPSEIEKRFLLFAERFIRMKKHNFLYESGKTTFMLGINQFSDLDEDELKTYRGYRPSLKSHNPKGSSRGAHFLRSAIRPKLPDTVDWRVKGAVTAVKDQGRCGSCYAFSTTGSLEGQHFRKTGVLTSLSEQQIVDCSAEFGNLGCGGGLMDNSFQYIRATNGIDTENSYPYVSGDTGFKNQNCSYNPLRRGATATGFVDVLPHGDEEMLKEAVASVGPVSVAIDASQSTFMQYRGGIYEDHKCLNASQFLDHGVLVVGYGTEDGIPYWLVKNSWNTFWGLGGYIKMRRNANNMCGIATTASYPLV